MMRELWLAYISFGVVELHPLFIYFRSYLLGHLTYASTNLQIMYQIPQIRLEVLEMRNLWLPSFCRRAFFHLSRTFDRKSWPVRISPSKKNENEKDNQQCQDRIWGCITDLGTLLIRFSKSLV
jgi:hypothetical protein